MVLQTSESCCVSRALEIRQIEKPWGRDTLPAPFGNGEGRRIGEIWFDPPAELSQILVKYIFTSEKLSVQTHPSDIDTHKAGLGRQGKDECWLILDAEPDAQVGIGFAESLCDDAMRDAALDGSIEARMVWHSVKAGDFFYIPAGTVHAIGAGISLIEVQQNSDITYRLFDYGRPRTLHLEQGIAVALGERYDTVLCKTVPLSGTMQLVSGPKFTLDQIRGDHAAAMVSAYPGPFLIIPRDEPAHICGCEITPGSCGMVASWDELVLHPTGTYLITQPRNA